MAVEVETLVGVNRSSASSRSSIAVPCVEQVALVVVPGVLVAEVVAVRISSSDCASSISSSSCSRSRSRSM
eukprot:2267892-Pyramimonas_sp.AAC.1